MAKVNNIIKLYEFKNEEDLCYQIDKDMDTARNDTNSYTYKLQTVQIISPNKALAVMEEDTDRIPVEFYYKYYNENPYTHDGYSQEEIGLDELPSDRPIMSVNELKLLNELKKVTINSLDYDIESIQYIIESTGEKLVQIILK